MDFERVMAQKARSEDGVSIAWYDFGGNGPDLLLGHATGFCAMVWAPVAAALADRFRCIGYDMRGHGLSGRPENTGDAGWDWRRYAGDAQSVIEASGVSKVFGVGHSSGAATQLLLEQARPNTFRSLYLFEPVLFPVEPPTGPDHNRDLAVRARRRRNVFSSRDEAAQTFATRGPFVEIDRRSLAAYVDYGFQQHADGTVELRCRPDDEAEVYVMASAHDSYSRLGSVQCPVTLAHGTESKAFSESHLRLVAERLPHCTFVNTAGVGHFGPLERPDEFAQSVIEAFGGQ